MQVAGRIHEKSLCEKIMTTPTLRYFLLHRGGEPSRFPPSSAGLRGERYSVHPSDPSTPLFRPFLPRPSPHPGRGSLKMQAPSYKSFIVAKVVVCYEYNTIRFCLSQNELLMIRKEVTNGHFVYGNEKGRRNNHNHGINDHAESCLPRIHRT